MRWFTPQLPAIARTEPRAIPSGSQMQMAGVQVPKPSPAVVAGSRMKSEGSTLPGRRTGNAGAQVAPSQLDPTATLLNRHLLTGTKEKCGDYARGQRSHVQNYHKYNCV